MFKHFKWKQKIKLLKKSGFVRDLRNQFPIWRNEQTGQWIYEIHVKMIFYKTLVKWINNEVIK